MCADRRRLWKAGVSLGYEDEAGAPVSTLRISISPPNTLAGSVPLASRVIYPSSDACFPWPAWLSPPRVQVLSLLPQPRRPLPVPGSALRSPSRGNSAWAPFLSPSSGFSALCADELGTRGAPHTCLGTCCIPLQAHHLRLQDTENKCKEDVCTASPLELLLSARCR